MLKTAYQPLINIAFEIMLPKLRVKYTEGYGERRGEYDRDKLNKLRGARPFWIHAVSVGEVQAAVPLIRAMRGDGFDDPVILSTTTETGKAMANGLADGLFDFHIYYPWDKKKFVKSALDGLNPCAFATMETELWPNMLWELRERDIPVFLANGRISDRTRKRLGGTFGRRIGKEMFGLFTAFYLRGEEDKRRLLELGLTENNMFVTGDSKIDELLSRKNEIRAALPQSVPGGGAPPVFIAGSTHEGEELVVINAYLMLKKEAPEARLIIAPRHPVRAEAVRSLLPRELSVNMLSERAEGWEVMVVDRIGCLFDLYKSGTAAFVGGSLVEKGGQNILEPAVWGLPVQHGPYMDDFAAPAAELAGLGLAEVVHDSGELFEAWRKTLSAETGGEKYLRISSSYFEKYCGASKRVWSSMKRYLEI